MECNCLYTCYLPDSERNNSSRVCSSQKCLSNTYLWEELTEDGNQDKKEESLKQTKKDRCVKRLILSNDTIFDKQEEDEEDLGKIVTREALIIDRRSPSLLRPSKSYSAKVKRSRIEEEEDEQIGVKLDGKKCFRRKVIICLNNS